MNIIIRSPSAHFHETKIATYHLICQSDELKSSCVLFLRCSSLSHVAFRTISISIYNSPFFPLSSLFSGPRMLLPYTPVSDYINSTFNTHFSIISIG